MHGNSGEAGAGRSTSPEIATPLCPRRARIVAGSAQERRHVDLGSGACRVRDDIRECAAGGRPSGKTPGHSELRRCQAAPARIFHFTEIRK
ncbi:hypothetical protein BJS_00738 [Bradyrhizobium japonicum SEMIA 5079]|nr:hypothetical protein BJS_00738 [Bradyrhizobium japonicum SEMIA 5079]